MGLFGFIPKGIRKGVRDIFDANTEEDKRKRQAMGQAREYSQQTGTQKRANFIAGASRAAVSTSIPALQVRAINAGVGLFNKGLGQKLQSGQSDAEAGVGRYVADTPKTAVQLYGATNDLANNNPLLPWIRSRAAVTAASPKAAPWFTLPVLSYDSAAVFA